MASEVGHLRLVEGIERDFMKAQKPSKDTFHRHQAMSQLMTRVVASYEDVVDKIYAEILRFVGTEIVPGTKLKKAKDDEEDQGRLGFVGDVDWPDDEMISQPTNDADSPYSPTRFMVERKFSLLTPTQLETIKQIVRDYHAAFAVGAFGPDSIPPEEVRRLMDTGILPQDLGLMFQPRPGERPPESLRITDMAYQYGALMGDPAQRAKPVVEMGYDAFVEHLDATRRDMSPVERQAMAFARYNAGEHVRGMGDRFATSVSTLIRDNDAEQRRNYMGTIRRELEANIDKRESWRKLASEIGHATQDWSRDMQRLASTEKQFAMQEGTARAMAKDRDPEDIRVAKIPTPDACKDCIRLHLTAGAGSPPRIFKLSELQANGTNVGKKRANWQATVGPVHPWCGCDLQEVPDGWAFNEDGDLVHESLLKKAGDAPTLTYKHAVPERGLVIRVGDPQKRQIIEKIVAPLPPEIFDKRVGITLITDDIPRVQNSLEDDDYAYWTGNEIRLNRTLPIERLPRVLRHELGHTLNVYLMHQLGGLEPVRRWHDRLWKVSKQEGWVSEYAKKLPIENAAEVTRMYLFEKPHLLLNHPGQFAFVHEAYRGIWNQ